MTVIMNFELLKLRNQKKGNDIVWFQGNIFHLLSNRYSNSSKEKFIYKGSGIIAYETSSHVENAG
jgi:hypothetical protein